MKLLVAVLKLLVTVIKFMIAVLKHCSSLEVSSSRPGASDRSPKTSGSSHQDVCFLVMMLFVLRVDPLMSFSRLKEILIC